MKNFEVHDLTEGWTGQETDLVSAIKLRDDIIQSTGNEVKITAEVDEEDLA